MEGQEELGGTGRGLLAGIQYFSPQDTPPIFLPLPPNNPGYWEGDTYYAKRVSSRGKGSRSTGGAGSRAVYDCFMVWLVRTAVALHSSESPAPTVGLGALSSEESGIKSCVKESSARTRFGIYWLLRHD